MALSRDMFAQFNAADGRLRDPAFQSATSMGTPTALPNLAQAFTADPTYENFKNLNQQQNTLTNAFGRGNTPFTLQDIQGVTSAFQQAIQPYAKQFQEQSGQDVLAERAAIQQRQQDQLRLQMQEALGPGAVIQGEVTAPFNPFQQQAPSIPLNQSPMKEMSGIDTETAFRDAVRAANPGLNFGDRNPFRMSMDRDIYDQAEDYYRQYGTGLPQFQQPATQTRALDPQNSNPNSAASQLSSFLAGVNNSPTGSMLGSAGTLPVPPAVQPFLQNTPQMLGGFGQIPNLSQMLGGPQPSVPTAPTAPTAPTSFGGSAFGQAGGAFPSTPGNYGGGASGGMALEGRYGIASGNSTPFPIQGNVSVVKLAQGGDVSKARQMLQNLTSPVQHFAGGSEVVPAGFRRSLFTGELVPIAATVEQLTDIYRGGEAQQANADAAARAVAAAETPVQASPAVSAAPAPETRLSLFTNEPVPVNASVQDLADIYSDYSFPSEPPASETRLSLFTNEPVPVNASVQDLTDIYSDYSFPSEPAASTVTASPSTVTASPSTLDLSKVASPPPSNLSEGLQYATGEDGIGAAKYYENIRNFVNTQGADLNAAEVRAEMNKYGISDKDVRDALAGTQYSGAAVHALLNPNIGAADAPGRGVGGLEGMSANIRDFIQDQVAAKMTREQLGNVLTQQMGAYNPETGVGGFNEQDLIRATGKTASQLLNDLYGVNQKPPPVATTVVGGKGNDLILQPPPDLPPLTDIFVPPTAPPPSAPPPALTPGQEGLDPGTAIVGKIPESERVKLPQLDTEFRASAPRTAIYDRFGRITGYNYSPAAKLTPATGTNVFNWTPPGITSRPRSLLNIGDVPGVTIDPVTGQPTLGLSASQRFARDRAELDNQFRQLYARAAAADTSLPTQAPSTAAAAFRQFAMNDPTMSAQLRMRNIEQTPTVSPTAAMVAARSEYGAAPYAAALTQAFDPFLARNRASLLASKDMQRSYFERYPDLVAEYEKNWSKTMSPEEYAAYHYRTLGQKEGRTPPNLMGSPYTQQFFSKGGEASTEDFIKKQSGGDVSRGTSEVPQLDAEGRLIDEREEIRSESQRMLNRLQSQPSKLPPGLRRTVAATKEQGKESMFPAAAPARDLLSGILGASPTAPGSEAYRTGQAIANMPPVQAAAAIPAKIAASAGDAATALAAMGPAMAGAVRPYGKGTVFSGVKLANDRYVGSSLDDYIDQGKSAAFRTSDVVKADAIQKFFDTKARRYMSTQLGTERDPVFDAIKKGRISNLALHDIQGLRKYAIEAAGEGKYKVDKETGKNVLDQYGRPIFYPKDPQAVMDVTKAYDEMVDVKPMSFKPGLIPQTYKTSDPAYMQEAERIREQMLQAFEAEGLDPRLVNLKSDPMILTSTRDTGEPYYPGYLYRMDDFIKDKLSGNPEAMKGVPENIRRALDQDELLYDVGLKRGPLEDILDPESMANYLATLSPKEIDKIRFEDAVVGSAKFNRERIDRKFEGLRLQELVKSGKAPDKVFSKGVSEPLLQFGEDQRHPGFAWKRIEDLEATIPEGAYVGHSVGGYALGGTGYGPSFTKGFQEGTHEIYSLRDARNRPVTTIQVIDYGDKSNPYRVVKQIKGNGAKTGNTAPVDYDVEVYDFLTQVVKPDAITESDSYLTPMLIQYRDALEANRQTR